MNTPEPEREIDFMGKDSEMPDFPNDPATRFLDYYGRYLIAKSQKESDMIWLCAVACRRELRKMGDPAKEAQFCESVFEGLVRQEKAAQIYRELYDNSLSLID